jgi:tRNA(Ile2)-agmatinylcytidine synthase
LDSFFIYYPKIVRKIEEETKKYYGGTCIWIGIDDTDSRDQGCTTYLVNDLLEEFKEYMVIGYPCLVRLNPNIPWKTRGNGAVCVQFKPRREDNGRGYQIGASEQGDTIYGHPGSGLEQRHYEQALMDDLTAVAERIDGIVMRRAALEDDTTNPGFVISAEGLPLGLYWATVRDVVRLGTIKKQLNSLGSIYKGYKSGRGVIGASAAIAWGSHANRYEPVNLQIFSSRGHQSLAQEYPALDRTYELIAYRAPSRWGTVRKVNPEAVLELDRNYPSTFNNYDHESQHVVITPNSPCPVLYGIRGDSVADLQSAFTLLADRVEPVEKWLIFNTNQGTDDHLISTRIATIKPYSSVIVTGRVSELPSTIMGGHVLFKLEELGQTTESALETSLDNSSKKSSTKATGPSRAKITCAAYEPTKGFRNIIRGLLPRDIVKVYGGIRAEPITINTEKLAITKLVQQKVKVRNPRCTSCGRTMKSIGRGKGYRCRKCHKVTTSEECTYESRQRELSAGYYEVPVEARRHLSKPLKRMVKYPGTTSQPPKTF